MYKLQLVSDKVANKYQTIEELSDMIFKDRGVDASYALGMYETFKQDLLKGYPGFSYKDIVKVYSNHVTNNVSKVISDYFFGYELICLLDFELWLNQSTEVCYQLVIEGQSFYTNRDVVLYSQKIYKQLPSKEEQQQFITNCITQKRVNSNRDINISIQKLYLE